MADVVFILGAGCSVHAGAPVMANFLDTARNLLAAGAVNDRREEFETALRVISYLQRVNSKAQLDHNNIETVFSAVDLARTIKKLPGAEPEAIDGAVSALKWLIVRTLEQSILFDTKAGRTIGTSQYATLAELINNIRGRTPKLTTAVLTFNYDIAADVSFAWNNVPYTYGLNGVKDQEVPYLKLHGSLNWFREQKDEKAVIAYPMRDYLQVYKLPYFSGDSEPSVPVQMSKIAIEGLRNQHARFVYAEPVIVPPTWSKGEYHRELQNVWKQAARELEEASYVFVIGYSLPETDQFFRLLFALGTEGLSVLNRIEIFDPKPEDVEKRFREMLGGSALSRFRANRVDFRGALQVIDQYMFMNGKRPPQ